MVNYSHKYGENNNYLTLGVCHLFWGGWNLLLLILSALSVISIKILLVILMLYETDWWWELRRWSHKIIVMSWCLNNFSLLLL